MKGVTWAHQGVNTSPHYGVHSPGGTRTAKSVDVIVLQVLQHAGVCNVVQ